jgi:PAS domain S-box-containing protein
VRLESHQEMETVLRYSSDAFIVTDREGKILFFNSAIDKLSGFSLKDYLGKNMKNLLDKKLISRSTALEAIRKKKTITDEIETFTGKKLLVTSSPVINASGSLDRIVCNVRGYSVIQKKLMNNYSAATDPELLEIEEKKLHYYYDEKKSYNLVYINSCDNELVFINNIMKELAKTAIKLGQVESTVLIHGETGTGKELIANLIHDSSPRAETGSLIIVNCASIPVNLVESELFGYEYGSFTGALKEGRKGYFELADGGTLLLDEISELPLEVQAKLLRVLQEKKIYKVGSTKEKPVDIRIIAATNRNLEHMVREGKFREDLYYRLNVIPIEVPPLRSRKDDIPVLFNYFVKKFSKEYGIHKKEMSNNIIDHLLRYAWPGNVRELANLVERLLVTIPAEIITLSHLSEPYSSCSSQMSRDKFSIYGVYPLEDVVSEFELAVVKKAIEQSKTYAEASNILGISLSTLMRKIRKLKQKVSISNV